MSKIFEDDFSKLQADMVSICLKYVKNKADKLFIYCSIENRMLYFNVFYQIQGKILHKHQLNEVDQQYDTSASLQEQVLQIGKDDLESIFKSPKRPNPASSPVLPRCFCLQTTQVCCAKAP